MGRRARPVVWCAQVPVDHHRCISRHLHGVQEFVRQIDESLLLIIGSDGCGSQNRLSKVRVNWRCAHGLQSTDLIRAYNIKSLQRSM